MNVFSPSDGLAVSFIVNGFFSAFYFGPKVCSAVCLQYRIGPNMCGALSIAVQNSNVLIWDVVLCDLRLIVVERVLLP